MYTYMYIYILYIKYFYLYIFIYVCMYGLLKNLLMTDPQIIGYCIRNGKML